jgi:hypothetical protein
MSKLFRTPTLTRRRIQLAFVVAILSDAVQLGLAPLGPLGWIFVDEIIDVVAMILTSWLLGFHLLLVPTFLVELIPVVDMLPTWTGCVALLVSIRKREQSLGAQTEANSVRVIDVGSDS